MSKKCVPVERIRQIGDRPANAGGNYVLYWMIANRRTRSNYSLDRAIEWSRKLDKPLVVLEALRAGYRWASDRIHSFVIEGMIENGKAFAKAPVTWFPWLESRPGDGKGLLAGLARDACVVVSDDFPCFFLPRMIESASRQIPVLFEVVDSNGMIPMRHTSRIFARAVDFRRYLQKEVGPWLDQRPVAEPLKNLKLPQLAQLPVQVTRKWPVADLQEYEQSPERFLAAFPVDHSVTRVDRISGGSTAAKKQLARFVSDSMLGCYPDQRNEPEKDVASGLSPWLHFGHLSIHDVFEAVTGWKPWSSEKIAPKATGSKEGWWGAAPEVESFLDELITWRELGFNMCALNPEYDQYHSLPDWALRTLDKHRRDRRAHVYSLQEFASGATHDPLWNAAQGQLVEEGRIHNYLRMLWGKKILEWTESPEQALEFMIELNNRYALDGRNPNSYSGIFWVLGRYDRPWGPERPIYGNIRYMTSENTARKVKVKDYIRRYTKGNSGGQCSLF
jgi:deoxyribodipyrimidine photo-lyase